MTEVYEKAMQAIGEVEKAEAAAAAEQAVGFTMPLSIAVNAFAALHVAIKSYEADMAGDFKRSQLPSQYTRTTLDQLRKAVTIMRAAISANPTTGAGKP